MKQAPGPLHLMGSTKASPGVPGGDAEHRKASLGVPGGDGEHRRRVFAYLVVRAVLAGTAAGVSTAAGAMDPLRVALLDRLGS